MKITQIETLLLDIPTIRPHAMSFGTIEAVNVLLVRLWVDMGLNGVGEAVTLGGPTWSEETVETAKVIIDTNSLSNIKKHPREPRERAYRLFLVRENA